MCIYITKEEQSVSCFKRRLEKIPHNLLIDKIVEQLRNFLKTNRMYCKVWRVCMYRYLVCRFGKSELSSSPPPWSLIDSILLESLNVIYMGDLSPNYSCWSSVLKLKLICTFCLLIESCLFLGKLFFISWSWFFFSVWECPPPPLRILKGECLLMPGNIF